jgi:hypothetical protein
MVDSVERPVLLNRLFPETKEMLVHISISSLYNSRLDPGDKPTYSRALGSHTRPLCLHVVPQTSAQLGGVTSTHVHRWLQAITRVGITDS